MNAIGIVPTLFELKKAKAKVSAFQQKVDVNVQVTLTTFVRDKEGAVSQADIGGDLHSASSNFRDRENLLTLQDGALKQLDPVISAPVRRPRGWESPRASHVVARSAERPHCSTGCSAVVRHHPLRCLQRRRKRSARSVPINLTITVMESDDFGDVIAKGAKLVSDNKEKIVSEALKAVGLNANEKSRGEKVSRRVIFVAELEVCGRDALKFARAQGLAMSLRRTSRRLSRLPRLRNGFSSNAHSQAGIRRRRKRLHYAGAD